MLPFEVSDSENSEKYCCIISRQEQKMMEDGRCRVVLFLFFWLVCSTLPGPLLPKGFFQKHSPPAPSRATLVAWSLWSGSSVPTLSLPLSSTSSCDSSLRLLVEGEQNVSSARAQMCSVQKDSSQITLSNRSPEHLKAH